MEKKKMLYSSFNYNNKYFLIGTKEGCTIFQVDPFKKGFDLGIKGQFSMVQMYRESNIFIIAGSKENEKINDSDVIVWDDKKNQIIYKFKVKKKVLNLKLAFEKIIIVCKNVIYIFNLKNDDNLQNFQLIDIIETGENESGLIAVNNNQCRKKKEDKKDDNQKENEFKILSDNNDDDTIIVYPSLGNSKGKLTIKNYATKNYIYLNPDEKRISFFALSNDGKYLITAGIKSKDYLFIYKTEDGEKIAYLNKDINIKFIFTDSNIKYVAASGEKGYIHIWSLKNFKKKEEITFEDDREDIYVSNIHGFVNKEKSFNHFQIDGAEAYENIQFKEEKKSNHLFVITFEKNEYYFNEVEYENEDKIKGKKGSMKVCFRHKLI